MILERNSANNCHKRSRFGYWYRKNNSQVNKFTAYWILKYQMVVYLAILSIIMSQKTKKMR